MEVGICECCKPISGPSIVFDKLDVFVLVWVLCGSHEKHVFKEVRSSVKWFGV